MGLLDQARALTVRITSDLPGWSDDIVLISPEGDEYAMRALVTKHHIEINPDTGKPYNSRNAHISFAEANLFGQNPIDPLDPIPVLLYPIRNAQGIVDLSSHRVRCKDSTGATSEFVIKQWFPDETLGLIVCILGDYGED